MVLVVWISTSVVQQLLTPRKDASTYTEKTKKKKQKPADFEEERKLKWGVYSNEQFHNNTWSDQLKSNASWGNPMKKWNKKIMLYEQWVILKTFIEKQF